MDSVSCVTAGAYEAIGHYEIKPGQYGAIAVTESNGGDDCAAKGSFPAIDGIACSTGAPCVAVGGYGPAGANFLAAVTDEPRLAGPQFCAGSSPGTLAAAWCPNPDCSKYCLIRSRCRLLTSSKCLTSASSPIASAVR